MRSTSGPPRPATYSGVKPVGPVLVAARGGGRPRQRHSPGTRGTGGYFPFLCFRVKGEDEHHTLLGRLASPLVQAIRSLEFEVAEAKQLLDRLIQFCSAKITADRTAALRCSRYVALRCTDGNGVLLLVEDVVRTATSQPPSPRLRIHARLCDGTSCT